MAKIQYCGTLSEVWVNVAEGKIVKKDEIIEVDDKISEELVKTENWKLIKNKKENKGGK